MARAFPYRSLLSRRRLLETAGGATLALASPPALADAVVKLPLPGGPDERQITTAFPEKGALILQRTRPPLLETRLLDLGLFEPRPVVVPSRRSSRVSRSLTRIALSIRMSA